MSGMTKHLPTADWKLPAVFSLASGFLPFDLLHSALLSQGFIPCPHLRRHQAAPPKEDFEKFVEYVDWRCSNEWLRPSASDEWQDQSWSVFSCWSRFAYSHSPQVVYGRRRAAPVCFSLICIPYTRLLFIVSSCNKTGGFRECWLCWLWKDWGIMLIESYAVAA